MKGLEYLKLLSALAILASTYNTHFELLQIPRIQDVHLGLSLLCVSLFFIGIYHDHLSRQLMEGARQQEHSSFSLSPRAASEILFREGLLSFLLFLPVIPALLRFPQASYLGISLFLFPLHGLIRAFRTKWMKGMKLIVASDRFVYPLRSNRSIRYQDLQRVLVKYEHLYFVLRDGRVETFPLEFLPEKNEEALRSLSERLIANGVKGGEAVQELFPSKNPSV